MMCAMWSKHSAQKQKKDVEHREIRAAVFAWLREVVTESDVIRVESNEVTYVRYIFPIKPGDEPQRVYDVLGSETFVVRFGIVVPLVGSDAWREVFATRDVSIFESVKRPSRIVPLRQGFSSHEQHELLRIARIAFGHKIAHPDSWECPAVRGLPQRFDLKCSAGVAYWIDGALRGSHIVEARALYDGVAMAAMLAAKDERFAPIAEKDVMRTRIEVIVMVEPWLPFYFLSRPWAPVDHRYGYRLSKGNSAGWFLPEIFNIRELPAGKDFFAQLANEKAQLPQGSEVAAAITCFPVFDYIEDASGLDVVELYGPIPHASRYLSVSDTEDALRAFGREVADWLVRFQRKDGSWPLQIHALTGVEGATDIVRSALSVLALAIFALVADNKEYSRAASRAYDSLRVIADHAEASPDASRVLLFAYLGQAAYYLRRQKDTERYASRVAKHIGSFEFEPILHGQVAAALRLSAMQSGPVAKARVAVLTLLHEEVLRMFDDTEGVHSLTSWAQVVSALDGTDYSTTSIHLADWLASYCTDNGSFPNFDRFPYREEAYSRGTSKIVEVLALNESRFRPVIRNAFAWLRSLLYTDESMFFIRPAVREHIRGGFRHDYFRSCAWIDTNAHVLIGISRVLSSRARHVLA